MFKLFETVLFSLGLLCLIGCGNGAGDNASLTDSIADTAAVVKEEIVKMLPDTAYASASKVKFDIQIPDTTVDGTLVSIEDLYEQKEPSF